MFISLSAAVLLDETFFRTCAFECGINAILIKFVKVLKGFISVKIK